MKNGVFVFGSLLVAVVAFASFYLLKQPEKEPSAGQPTAVVAESDRSMAPDLAEHFVRPHSHRIGNSMANVTVVEWFDPECESCRAVHPVFKQIISEYQDRVLFVFRYMPYHQGSTFAAAALEEAKEFGKFPEALNLLYEHQPVWGSHHAPRSDLILSYLTPLGIPPERLEKEYLITRHLKVIETDKADGEKVGVTGTPTFFVNQIQIRGLDEETLRAAIETALAER